MNKSIYMLGETLPRKENLHTRRKVFLFLKRAILKTEKIFPPVNSIDILSSRLLISSAVI